VNPFVVLSDYFHVDRVSTRSTPDPEKFPARGSEYGSRGQYVGGEVVKAGCVGGVEGRQRGVDGLVDGSEDEALGGLGVQQRDRVAHALLGLFGEEPGQDRREGAVGLGR
jgi:hypothetical protein